MRKFKVASIANRVRDEIGALRPEERELAINALRDVLYEGSYVNAVGEPDNPEACVRCGSVHIRRKGHDANGARRWFCVDCKRTFNARTNRVIASSKLKPAVWMRFIECFVDCLSLRECAERCKVCLKTAFLMHRRIIECIRNYSPAFHADSGVEVQLDETYFRESFKGNHKRSSTFAMPRASRHRGTPASKRGLSKEQICVLTGVDDANAVFLTLSGRGALSSERAIAALGPRLSRGVHAITDKATAYTTAMPELGVMLTQMDAKKHAINRVNTLHSNLEGFMAGFRGVSTKHLQSYLDWFEWRRLFHSNADGDDSRLLARQLDNGLYRRRRTYYTGLRSPYLDYWGM